MTDLAVGTQSSEFLSVMPDLVLGTIRLDGSPQASPVWFLWTGHSFLVSTIESTAKWQNLLRDPRCSACVDRPETGQMIVAYGSAILHVADVWNQTTQVVEKYYPDAPMQAAEHVQRIASGPKRVLIEMIPESIITRRLEDSA